MTARDAPDRLAVEVIRAAARAGARRVLLLDLDGTLAPIAPRPERARVAPEVLGALRRLVRRGWSVAVVSGRPAAEARALVPVRGIRVLGGHGAERPGAARLPRELRARLTALAAAARARAARVRGARVEAKPWGVAFHDRGVETPDLRAWHLALREVLLEVDLDGLEVLTGRRVIEVRPRNGHKGLAFEAVVPRRRGGWPDHSVVALGDDRTDEDLFRALRGRGLAVRVGRPIRSTAATRRLASPGAVGRFLGRLAEAAEDASGANGSGERRG